MKKILLAVISFIISATSFGQFLYGNEYIRVTGAGSQTALNNNILLPSAGAGALDLFQWGAASYNQMTISVTPAAGTITTGVLAFEESDNASFTTNIPLYLFNANSTNTAASATGVIASTQTTYFGSIHLQYVRVRISTGVTGTTTGLQCIAYFRKVLPTVSSTAISNVQAGSLNVAIGTSASVPQATSTFLNAAATTNATNLKVTAGNVYTVFLTNISSSTKYFRLFNKASTPTMGTDIPLYTYIIPPNSIFSVPINDIGLKFTSGISYAITNGNAVLDATAVAAGDIQLTIQWN